MKGIRVTGLVLSIIAGVFAVLGIVFSAIGMSRARECKKCNPGGRI